jgi:hypothetical protein
MDCPTISSDSIVLLVIIYSSCYYHFSQVKLEEVEMVSGEEDEVSFSLNLIVMGLLVSCHS